MNRITSVVSKVAKIVSAAALVIFSAGVCTGVGVGFIAGGILGMSMEPSKTIKPKEVYHE